MNCPKCGSDSIHRSKRRGVGERFLLASLKVFPYRCWACRLRFRRFEPHRSSGVARFVSGAPEWLKRLVWSVAAVLIGLAFCLFVLLMRIKR